MILALLLSLVWNPSPDPSVTYWVATAWEVAPVVLPCSDPTEGDCIVAYLETWRQTQTVTTPTVTWTAPELVSGGVAYMTVERACRAGGCCSDGRIQ